MSQHSLASLHFLRTFLAVHETGSLKAAGNKIHLSTSAVSRQLQALEAELGFALFVRTPSGLTPTEAGNQFYTSAAEALSIIDHSIDAIKRKTTTHLLRLSTQPYFAKHWLMPKLHDFAQCCPDIQIQFDSRHTYKAFDASAIDAAIRFDPPMDDALDRIALFNQYALPVASPVLVEKFNLLQGVIQWTQCNWLKIDSRQDLWERWLAAHGHTHLTPKDTVVFDDADAILLAAANHMGIAIVAWPLCQNLLDEGKLTPLCEPSSALHSAYYLVHAKRLAAFEPLHRFKAWLLDQAANEPAIKDFK